MKGMEAVEELAKLLTEEERVETKIRETQAVLSDIRKKIPSP